MLIKFTEPKENKTRELTVDSVVEIHPQYIVVRNLAKTCATLSKAIDTPVYTKEGTVWHELVERLQIVVSETGEIF